MRFTEFKLTDEVLQGIEAMGFENASPVQELAIPHILNNKDLIVCAQTGTGKTAAFILPLMNKILENKMKGFTTLVLVPTRELAIQIDQQIEGFSYFVPISSLAVYGGGDSSVWGQQKKGLIEGADIVIATPGRMISHLNLGYVNCENIAHLVLDEADRMLDMGFFEDIMQIVKYLPEKRQNLMFSATMPPKIRELVAKILDDYEEINIAISKPAEGILQAAYMLYENQKIELINSLLEGKEDLQSIIIFSSTKSKVKEIYHSLKKHKHLVNSIHSDLEQSERENVLRDFKNRKFQILVATDIISRGIDIDSIDLVMNYDVPNDAEDYIHRVGRTARAKSEGVAITFITTNDQDSFLKIEKLIGSDIFKIPVPADLGEAPEYKPRTQKPRRFKFIRKRSKPRTSR
ncbi:MAG: DEAD/DEAH box helicase [Marinifilaceae bacterium]|nr:DEAD/DEAH box helicase [Marinifilaceae bacterium]